MKSRKKLPRSFGWRSFFLLVGAVSICGLVTGCLTVTGPPSQGKTAPVDPRAAELKKRIVELEKELQSVRDAYKLEYMEFLKDEGHGLRNPDGFGETIAMDGTLRVMHHGNLDAMKKRIDQLEAEIEGLHRELGNLEARRPKAEVEIVAPAPSASPDLSGGCFTPDTRILLPDGVRNIAAMSVGDELVAYDEATGELTARPVVQTYRFPANHYFVINGEIRVTAMHRFLTNRGWVTVKDLQIGDLLRTSDGWTLLESKEFVDASLEVFNLEVATNHDFFVVGDKHSYLVHNCGGGGK